MASRTRLGERERLALHAEQVARDALERVVVAAEDLARQRLVEIGLDAVQDARRLFERPARRELELHFAGRGQNRERDVGIRGIHGLDERLHHALGHRRDLQRAPVHAGRSGSREEGLDGVGPHRLHLERNPGQEDDGRGSGRREKAGCRPAGVR
jgi:hypothetical protein